MKNKQHDSKGSDGWNGSKRNIESLRILPCLSSTVFHYVMIKTGARE